MDQPSNHDMGHSEPHMDQPSNHDMGHSEQVLVTNKTRTIKEQLATLTAALQQRDDELAACEIR
jgi:hypothetical protein